MRKKNANLLAIPSLKLVNLTQANLYTQTKHNFIGLHNGHFKVIQTNIYSLFAHILVNKSIYLKTKSYE